MMNEFGKKIKELRGEKSIREAARGIGISHTYLDSLEKGYDPRTGKERKPTIEVISKISIYYDYEFSDLVELANIFVSLNDMPDKQKVIEATKLAERFSQQQKRKKKNLRKALEYVIENDIPSSHTNFLANGMSFIGSQEEEDIDFITILLQTLILNKGNKDLDSYEDIKNEFDRFLKSYLELD